MMEFIGTFIPITATHQYMYHLGTHPRGAGTEAADGDYHLDGDTHRGIGIGVTTMHIGTTPTIRSVAYTIMGTT